MLQKNSTSRSDFLRSEKAETLRQELVKMAESPVYNTKVATLIETDHLYFVEKHMKYMSNHLKMDHLQYIRNLKLMTKVL